jgi:hypothetical protein
MPGSPGARRLSRGLVELEVAVPHLSPAADTSVAQLRPTGSLSGTTRTSAPASTLEVWAGGSARPGRCVDAGSDEGINAGLGFDDDGFSRCHAHPGLCLEVQGQVAERRSTESLGSMRRVRRVAPTSGSYYRYSGLAIATVGRRRSRGPLPISGAEQHQYGLRGEGCAAGSGNRAAPGTGLRVLPEIGG